MKILAVSVLVVVAVLLVLYVTLIGRRRLAQRTTAVVPAPPRVPADGAGPAASATDSAPTAVGALRFGPVEAVYVSTTLHGDWLARVGAHGLGDRSRAVVSVHDGGVVVEREGADDVWIPVDALRGAGLAPGMAGKYVGTDGLVVLSWDVPEAEDVPTAAVDTGLRPRRAADRGGLVDAVRYLLAAQQQSPQQSPQQHTPQNPEQHTQHDPHQQEAR